MKIEDGGPAFPTLLGLEDTRESNSNSNDYAFPACVAAGMTLRDWFAGQALAGELAAWTEDQDSSYAPSKVAERMYAMADAMIAERQKGQGTNG